MFSKVGDKVDTDLHVRDLVMSNLDKGLQIKFPICFDCFDQILKNYEEALQEQSSSMNVYSEELRTIEKDIARVKMNNELAKAQPHPDGLTQ